MEEFQRKINPEFKNENFVDKAKKIEGKLEQAVEKVSKDLNIGLQPAGGMPFGLRLIFLLNLLGGVAILGNIFANIFDAGNVSFYFFRIFIGLIFLTIAYGIYKNMLFSVWFMGLISLFALISNLFIGVIPLLAFLYLYKRRKFFKKIAEYSIGDINIKI